MPGLIPAPIGSCYVLSALVHAQNSANLPDVIGIMPSHVNSQVANGDAAPLSMNAETLPLLRRELFQKLQVGIAQQTKQLERLLGLARRIATSTGPHVLIEAGKINAVVLKHLAIAP